MGKWKNDYNENRKYISSWEEGREWLTCTEDGRCFCRFCNCSFTAKVSTVQQHEKSKKHKKIMENNGLAPTSQSIKYKTGCVSKQEIQSEENYDTTEYINDETYEDVETPKKLHICLEPDKSFSKIREIRVINDGRRPSIISNDMSTPFRLPADSKFIILNNSSQNLLSNVSNEGQSDPLDSLVQNVTNSFKTDVHNFLRKNKSVTEYIQNNPDFADGEAGISRVTRMLVGQLAQQYLMDFTMESWRSRTNPNNSTLMSSKLSEIEKTMEQSVQEVKTIKAQFDAQDLHIQPSIILDDLNATF